MRKPTILLYLSIIFLLQYLFLNSAQAYLLFDPFPTINTNQKIYYPNEIIHINTSWNIYIETGENTIIQIALIEKAPHNMSTEQILMEAIEIIECPRHSGFTFFETSIDSNILFQAISGVPCTVWIALLFYNFVGGEIDDFYRDRFINAIVLDKYDLYFNLSFPDFFLMEFNETLIYNNSICALQNNSISYPNSHFYVNLFSENQLRQNSSININELGEFSINFSDFCINRSGLYKLCFVFHSNDLFKNYMKNYSLAVKNKVLYFYMINSTFQFIKSPSDVLDLSFLLLDQNNQTFNIQGVSWNINSTLEYVGMTPIDEQYHFYFKYPSKIGNYEVELSGLCQNYNLSTFSSTLSFLKNNLNLSLIFDTYKKNDSIYLFLLEHLYRNSNLTFLPYLNLQIYYNSSWIDVKFSYETVSEQNVSIQISWDELYRLVLAIPPGFLLFRPQIVENPYFILIDYSQLEIKLPIFAEFKCTSLYLTQNNNISFFFTGIADNTTSFLWDFGDGTISFEKNPIHRYVLHGDFVIALTITDSNNNMDNLMKIITIVPDFYPTAIYTISLTQALINQSLYFIFIGEQGNGNPSFLWNFGDYCYSNLMNPIHQYCNQGLYYISLQIMDVDGDIDFWQFPEPIFIETDQFPIARFSVNTTQIVADQAVKCLFLGDVGNNPVEFQWDFGDSQYSYERDPIHIYDQTGMFNITLVLEDANNDIDSWVYPEFIVVHPDLTPLATFITNATEIIAGQSIECTFTGNYGNQPSIFWWNFGDNQTSKEEQPIHTYTEEGIYSIFLRVHDIDFDQDFYRHYEEIIVVLDLFPNSDFVINKTQVQPNEWVQFFFTGDNGNEPTTYLWNFGDEFQSSNPNPVHRYCNLGKYNISLLVTDQDGDNCIKYMEILVQETAKIHFGTIILLGGIPIGAFGAITVSYRYLRKPKTIPLTRMKI